MVLYCGESICVREKPFPGTFNQLAPSSLIHNCLLRDSLPRRPCIHNHYLLMFRFMAFINHNDVHNWRFNLELATRFQAIDSRIIFTFTSFLCMFIKFVMLPSFSPKSSFRSLRCVSFPCEISKPHRMGHEPNVVVVCIQSANSKWEFSVFWFDVHNHNIRLASHPVRLGN